MPYNDKGEWVDESQSVSDRVQGLLKPDSPLIKAAQTDALKTANRRGLLNSSMATQAGTRAALDVVVPIASQEASQTFQRNLSGQTFRQEGMLQAPRLASQEKIVGIQEAGAKERLGLELSSREKIAQQEQQGLLQRQQIDIEAQNARLERELGSREAVEKARRDLERELQGERLTTEERLAADTIRADNERETARLNQERSGQVATAITNVNVSYTNAYNAILSNPDIPAAERARQLEHIAAKRDSDLMMIEQLYEIDLDWPLTEPGTADPGAPTVNDAARRAR